MPTFTPTFSQVTLYQIAPGEKITPDFSVRDGTLWEIKSAGIGGSKGALYLYSGENPVAILFSTISNDDYGSELPFALPGGFTGTIKNDSSFHAIVSITEYELVEDRIIRDPGPVDPVLQPSEPQPSEPQPPL